jgi:hypothetical protein
MGRVARDEVEGQVNAPATPAFPISMQVRKCMEQLSASTKPEKTATAMI